MMGVGELLIWCAALYLFFGMLFASSYVSEGQGARERTMLFFAGLFLWPLPIAETAFKGIAKYVVDFVNNK